MVKKYGVEEYFGEEYDGKNQKSPKFQIGKVHNKSQVIKGIQDLNIMTHFHLMKQKIFIICCTNQW